MFLKKMVIGLEVGSVWSRLSWDIEVLEFARNIFERQGLNFKLESKVTSAQVVEEKVEFNVSSVYNHIEKNKLWCCVSWF